MKCKVSIRYVTPVKGLLTPEELYSQAEILCTRQNTGWMCTNSGEPVSLKWTSFLPVMEISTSVLYVLGIKVSATTDWPLIFRWALFVKSQIISQHQPLVPFWILCVFVYFLKSCGLETELDSLAFCSSFYRYFFSQVFLLRILNGWWHSLLIAKCFSVLLLSQWTSERRWQLRSLQQEPFPPAPYSLGAHN